MLTKNSKSRETAGSRNSNEPRRIGQVIIDDVLFSNEHSFGVGYRQRKLFEDFYPNTELDVDLKLLTRKPGHMSVGEYLDGTLVHDADDHFLFAEKVVEKEVRKRNPCHYQGQHISCTIRPDGKPRLNFKQLKLDAGFNKFRYASEVMNEVIQALDLAGL